MENEISWPSTVQDTGKSVTGLPIQVYFTGYYSTHNYVTEGTTPRQDNTIIFITTLQTITIQIWCLKLQLHSLDNTTSLAF